MFESIYFAPVLVVSIIAILIGGFQLIDLAKAYFEQKKHEKLARLKMSQCEACKDYHIWNPGDEVFYKIDEQETGVGELLTFHPEKVILKNHANKEVLVDPYLIIENKTAQVRKHVMKSENFLKALNSENSNLFLPEHQSKNNEESHARGYSELSA